MSMLAAGFGQTLMTIVIVLVCVFLMLIILVQQASSGGLTSAFGGGGTSSAFGAKTGDVFTVITVSLAAIYLLFNIFGNYAFRPAEIAPVSAAVAPVENGPGGTTGEQAPAGTPESGNAATGTATDAAGSATTTPSEPGTTSKPAGTASESGNAANAGNTDNAGGSGASGGKADEPAKPDESAGGTGGGSADTSDG